MSRSEGRLEGRVAVITGGASGMGRSTVLRFLDEGASIVVADLNEATGKETVELADKQEGVEPHPLHPHRRVADEARRRGDDRRWR